jgi:hypothetical protein
MKDEKFNLLVSYIKENYKWFKYGVIPPILAEAEKIDKIKPSEPVTEKSISLPTEQELISKYKETYFNATPAHKRNPITESELQMLKFCLSQAKAIDLREELIKCKVWINLTYGTEIYVEQIDEYLKQRK